MPAPCLSADRLLLQRLRKSQSTSGLYEDIDGLQLSDTALPYPLVDGSAPQRLLVIANRLPVSAFKDRGGQWQLQVSAGGLVSALMGVSNIQTKWIGWPGEWQAGRQAGAGLCCCRGGGGGVVCVCVWWWWGQ